MDFIMFRCPERYSRDAAEDAWQKTLKFSPAILAGRSKTLVRFRYAGSLSELLNSNDERRVNESKSNRP